MGGALQGMLTRQRRYRGLAARTLIGQGTGMVLGLILAFHGAGAWALVLQQASGSLVAALVLIVIAGWRPRLVCHWPAVRSLLRIGVPLTASTLLQIGRYRVFAILIAGTAGAAPLGQVHMAFRMVDTVREITFTAMWRLLLPILSEHQRDQTHMRREVDRLLRLSSLVTMPLCGGLAVTLVPVTALVLGPAWHAAATAAAPLVLLMGVAALMFPSGAALIASGLARFALYANLVCLLAAIALTLLVRPETAWTAALVWCAAQIVALPYNLWVNGRALGFGPLRPLRAGATMALVSAVSAAAALAINAATPGETLFWRVAVFALVLGGFGLAWLALSRSERWRIIGARAPGRGT
jgi:O-antigen/teichoic acid export membrane protein